MAVFYLAQISDLHLCIEPDWLTPFEVESVTGKIAAAYDTLLGRRSSRGRLLPGIYPSSFSADVAAGLLKHLIPKMRLLDALIISGDLATSGREDDLQVARAYFEGRIPEEWNPWHYLETGAPATLLGIPGQCVVTIPGNHDRYDGVFAAPALRAFERHFGEDWDFGRAHASQIPMSSNRVRLVFLKKGDAALVVCMLDCSLNSTEETTRIGGRWGQGRITDQLLKDAELVTRTARQHASSAGLTPAIAWVAHFPPLHPDIDPDLELIDGESLVVAAEKCGVDMILSGHTHKPLGYKARGQIRSIPVYCAGATTGISRDNVFAYTHLQIEVTTSGVSVDAKNFVWSDSEHELTFVPAPEFPKWTARLRKPGAAR
jgi:3',5'-cyclic AMP phosphodiesterase CpdA